MLQSSIAEQVRLNARAYPHRVAIQVVDGPDLTYGQAWQRVVALAHLLAAVDIGDTGGIRPVAYLLPNGCDAILLPLACQLAGCTAVPLDSRLAMEELAERTADCGAEVIISSDPHLDRAARLGLEVVDAGSMLVPADINSDQFTVEGARPLIVGYTSGTTGLPKGALYTGDNLYLQYVRWGWQYSLTAGDTVLTAGPQFHNSYLGLSLLALMAGATNRVLTSFDADVAREELTQHSSFAFLVPSMLDAVLAGWRVDGRPLHTARFVLSSGAPVGAELLAEAMHAFPRAEVAEAYGWSEGGWVTLETKTTETLVPGSVGWPMVGVDLALVGDDDEPVPRGEAGEIVVRNLSPFSGYLKREHNTAESEWRGYLRSGDVGQWLEDGRLCLCDRKKDVIVTGGENVYSAEVERVLATCPGVAEAAVVGRPSRRWGEEVVAVVVVAGHVGEAEIRSHCRDRLAGFKVPKRVEFVPALPRNAMGKVQKVKLRDEGGTWR